MIDIQDRAGVRIVALQRPPVNALDLPLAEALERVVAAAHADRDGGALVITGAPGVFSAGIDTREVPRYGAERRSAMLRAVNRTILALYAFPRPLVAAVSGHALGGALVLALTADLRLAARGEFRLGLTEAAAGIPFPAGPLAVVRAELSPENQRVLVLQSPVVGPDALHRMGVIDRVVDPTTLLDEAVQAAEQLAAMPAFGRVKDQLRRRTLARLRRIVERDEEPLHAGWVQTPPDPRRTRP